MRPDLEADACRCPRCTGKTIDRHLARDLRLVYPLPTDECPEDIVETLLKIDTAYVEAAEPLFLPREPTCPN